MRTHLVVKKLFLCSIGILAGFISAIAVAGDIYIIAHSSVNIGDEGELRVLAGDTPGRGESPDLKPRADPFVDVSLYAPGAARYTRSTGGEVDDASNPR